MLDTIHTFARYATLAAFAAAALGVGIYYAAVIITSIVRRIRRLTGAAE